MFIPPLAVTGASAILQDGLKLSTNLGDSWNKQWLTIFDSALFHAIVSTAALFAAATLVFFMLLFIKRMVQEEDYFSALQSLILAVVLCGLLANHGFFIARGVRTLRAVVHNLSNQVLEVTLLDVRIRDAIQASAIQGSVVSEINAQLSQCYGMTGQKQLDCLKAANAQVDATIGAYETHIKLPGQLRNLKRGIEGAIENVQLTDPRRTAAGFLGGFLGSASEDLIQLVLTAFQWGFTNILEIALLLTGLFAPFAVAGAFMFDGKSLWAWLTGFFALGMAKVSYNIIVGLAAVVVVNAETTDTLGFLVIMAILAPALALALAAGAGMSVFHVINTGMARAIGTMSGFAPVLDSTKVV